MGALIADRIVRTHLRTMARMNVDYDLLTWEGDILRLHFWTTAFEQLKSRKAVFLQTEGRLKGCWVMPIEDRIAETRGRTARMTTRQPTRTTSRREQREKVIVRSNGTVTYVGKDIANQFWKFGLLGRDFHYRVFEPRGGPSALGDDFPPGSGPRPPEFGRATAVYNVIDSRQAYLQQLLKQALATMGFNEQADSSTHYSYEMVALSHSTARALGYQDTDSSGKPFVEVSGRKGLGVKADDLLDRLITTALGEVTSRNPELGADERQRIAETIATAAVRYFLVKFSRGKIIAFDIEEALSFEGETGPYLQYAVVRANNIFAKLGEREGLTEAGVVEQIDSLGREALDTGDGSRRAVGPRPRGRPARRGRRRIRPVARALGAGEVRVRPGAGVQRVLSPSADPARGARATRVSGARPAWPTLRRQLTRALDLMGCAVPVRM